MFDVMDLFIPGKEFWNNELQEFIYTKDITLHLKHSLVSLTRWEQHYKRRFLDDGPKNEEEYRFYIQCMTLNKDVDPLIYTALQEDDLKKVTDYLHESMTATTLPKQNDKHTNSEKLSSELIYYYLSALNIPFDCDKWFLNNLLTVINIASIKNAPQEKKSKPSWSSIRALNAARNAKARG
mgnify:CR=1 FL=1